MTPDLPAKQRFRDWLATHTLQTVSGQSFVLTGHLRLWLNSKNNENDGKTNLENLYDASGTTKPRRNESSILIFSVLLDLGIEHLLDHFQSAGISDSDLPLSEQVLLPIAGPLEEPVANKILTGFSQQQWRYCPASFELGQCREWGIENIIPICQQRKIGDGQTGTVYEVVIPEDCVGTNLRKEIASSRTKDKTLFGNYYYRIALKTFDEWHTHLGRREMEAFRWLEGQEGYIKPLSMFKVKQDQDEPEVYSILLERGKFDLNTCFESQPPPVNSRAIRVFWKKICEIGTALEHLQEISIPPSSGIDSEIKAVGFHHDLKPSNIILSAGRFKISDFGFSKFLVLDGHPIPPSAVVGTLSYGPPETNLTTTNPTIESLQKFDLWSFGCVLSETASWIVLGQRGLEQFRTIRAQSLDKLCNMRKALGAHESGDAPRYLSRRGDYFHDGVKVLDIVTLWHNHLRNSARKCDAITSKILDIVDNHLLVSNVQNRVNATELCVLLSQIWEKMDEENAGEFFIGELGELLELDQKLWDPRSAK